MRRGAQFSWLPFGYWFSIDPRTFAGEAASVGDDNVELAIRRALKKKAWDLLASSGSGPMRIGIYPDVSIAQDLRVQTAGRHHERRGCRAGLVLLPTLARSREEHPRESHFLDAPDEHAVGSEMRDHPGTNVISLLQGRTEPFEPRRCRHGTNSSPRREPDMPAQLLRALFGNLTEPKEGFKSANIRKTARRASHFPASPPMSSPCAILRSRQPRSAFMGLSRGRKVISMLRLAVGAPGPRVRAAFFLRRPLDDPGFGGRRR